MYAAAMVEPLGMVRFVQRNPTVWLPALETRSRMVLLRFPAPVTDSSASPCEFGMRVSRVIAPKAKSGRMPTVANAAKTIPTIAAPWRARRLWAELYSTCEGRGASASIARRGALDDPRATCKISSDCAGVGGKAG